MVSDAIVGYHLNTMCAAGRRLRFAAARERRPVAQILGDRLRAIEGTQGHLFETEGKNKGCWVMPASAFKEQTGEDTDDSKVIVRSNSTVTYVGKDIAYQLWKFGLLGKDFYYRQWHAIRTACTMHRPTEPQPPPDRAVRRTANRVYNVIDSRQSYLQDVVVAGLRALGYNQQADRSIHFSYEMVALSPAHLRRAGHRTVGRRQAKRRTSRSRAAKDWASKPTI